VVGKAVERVALVTGSPRCCCEQCLSLALSCRAIIFHVTRNPSSSWLHASGRRCDMIFAHPCATQMLRTMATSTPSTISCQRLRAAPEYSSPGASPLSQAEPPKSNTHHNHLPKTRCIFVKVIAELDSEEGVCFWASPGTSRCLCR
jgi:hypothetical protein